MRKPKFKRIVLKLSGEALAGQMGYGLDPAALDGFCTELKEVSDLGVQMAVVVGGGNIYRGLKGSLQSGVDRTVGDYMGMLATVMNAMALQTVLERHGVQTRVQSAIAISQLCEPYIRRRAIRHIEKGRIVIFAAGTGNPYFTTDTAAALRAMEIGAEVILKATNVDGVYDSDPKLNPGARRFEKLSYFEVLKRNLKVMDSTSISLCMDNNLPIIVFGLQQRGNIARVVCGEDVGTLVSNTRDGGA